MGAHTCAVTTCTMHRILHSHHCGLITCQGRQGKMTRGLRSDIRAAPGGGAALIPEQPRLQAPRSRFKGNAGAGAGGHFPDAACQGRKCPRWDKAAGGAASAAAAPRHPHHTTAATHARAHTRPPLAAPARPRASRLPLPLLDRNRFPGWFSPRWPPLPVPAAPRLSSNYLLGDRKSTRLNSSH